MYCVREVTDRLYWVGANDYRLTLFENIHPIPKGVSYNSYLLLDEKTVLFDTIDWSCCRQLVENVEHLLGDRALDGKLFADEVNFERDWLDDARRYYANIVGKYGAQVQALLKKAAGLDIAYICPLHGPIWRENIGWLIDKYQKWSTYAPEDRGVTIFCGSVYGNTENAADILACRLAEQGVKNITLYDVSHTDVSQLVSEAFRCSHLVLASATYNGAIFTPMENLLLDLKAHNLQNRTVAVIENGTWSAQAGKQMRELLGSMKNMTVLENTVSLKSSVKEAQRTALEALADELAADILK